VAEIPNASLKLAARAENILVVRQALAGVADCAGLDAVEANDLVTAATEAANNVVLHAYEGGEGPLEVEVFRHPLGLEVVVRDHGVGMRMDGAPVESVSAGIGLTVIQALAAEVQLADAEGGGVELHMVFATLKTLDPVPAGGSETHARAGGGVATAVELTLAPSRLARCVVPRVLSALAARAHFSTDRISDLQIVADALVAHAEGSISGTHLGLDVELAPRSLELQIGPLLAGSATSLLDGSVAGGAGPVIERLTDAQEVAPRGAVETLALRLSER
jgi:serine/threonine-protein kinase RsbW